MANIIPIALQIPDFEGQAVLRIFSNATQAEVGCYSALVTNGHSLAHASSVAPVLGFFTIVAILASFATAIVGSHIPTTRLHHAHSLSILLVFSVWHHIFYSGAITMNWPSVLPAFWSNFAWSAGMIYTESMQDSINHLIGKHVGNTSVVGAAGSGPSSDNVAGGYSISAIYKRSTETLVKRKPALLRDVMNGMRSNPSGSALAKRQLEDASSGFTYYGVPVKPGLPLPGNYSGFAGTLSVENIAASNAFMTGFLWLLIVLVIVTGGIIIFKFMVEGFARINFIKKDRLTYFRMNWIRYVTVTALRTFVIAFFMMMFLSLFQFNYIGSAGVTAIAAIVFIAFLVGVLGLAAYACYYRLKSEKASPNADQLHVVKSKLGPLPWFDTISTTRRSEKEDSRPSVFSIPWVSVTNPSDHSLRSDVHEDEDYIVKFGWLSARFRRSRWWFFAFWLSYELVRACFYGGAVAEPLTQVFGLLIIEIIAFVTIILIKPYEGRRLNVLLLYLLGFSKVATLALSTVFYPRFNLNRIIAVVVGIIIIVIQGFLTIALLILICISAVSSYFSVTRDTSFSPQSWLPLRERYFKHITRAARDRPQTPLPPPEEPKDPYFNVGSVRRLPKIEDEDDVEHHAGFDAKYDGPGSPMSHSPSPGPSRARSGTMLSTMSNSSLPFGARQHRTSWSTHDFNNFYENSNRSSVHLSKTLNPKHSDVSLSDQYRRAIRPQSRSNSMPLENIDRSRTRSGTAAEGKGKGREEFGTPKERAGLISKLERIQSQREVGSSENQLKENVVDGEGQGLVGNVHEEEKEKGSLEIGRAE